MNFLPEGVTLEDAAPIFIEGIVGGTIVTLGATAIGAFFSPSAAAGMTLVSATACGFITTSVMIEQAKAKKAKKKKK